MNWEMLAAFGQLAAVFIGIPSLIYLAVQIREQTKERRQSAVNALTAQWGDLQCRSMKAREFRQFIFAAASRSTISMRSPKPSSARFSIDFKNFQDIYFAHRHGILPDTLMARVERPMTDLIAYPVGQQWWQTRRHWHTEEFAGVVDGIIARGIRSHGFFALSFDERLAASPSYELWKINNAGLIAESSGHFDAAEYDRQLKL